ncbi:Aldo/keto reductase [Succinivibrio dextrinosolvens DSM 3072]|uniref:Aldo/keto reductase n=1 Tax=Succinivibrio dextrinosolvens DSM 3072 TaxID=1123324 RepID=A0A1T4V5X8_9GAMM|nr:aldo/keto reductase [Succinivibrio dextrinosolvens]SKA60252.1 Aldo/keto reductase [Succinivibrio dextrinosolvens DSM 3072]
MEYINLNNGVKMPMLGFGVFQIPEHKDAVQAVNDALETGYRLIDTAAAYFNEEAVGEAISQSGINRSELFITTKLWVQDHGYDNTLRAFDTSMKKLKLDILDLYLIHKPYGDYYGSWRAMERLYKEGRIRAIGVTSFWNERLADLFTHNEIKPAVNQIETNVWLQQQEAHDFMVKHNIVHEAWSPFAEGNNNVFKNEILEQIARKHNKTTAQIMLRWLIQRNIPVIPKSSHKERIISNFDIFDFKLDEEDLLNIQKLDTKKSTIYDEMNPDIAISIGSHRIHD